MVRAGAEARPYIIEMPLSLAAEAIEWAIYWALRRVRGPEPGAAAHETRRPR